MPAKIKLMETWNKKRLQIIFILILLAISIFLRSNSIMMPIVGDAHDFRQAQTAITIQDFFNHGLSIFDYKTPIFGPPWQIPMEFPIYQVTVFIFMKIFGMTNIDLGCRLISFIYFYLSAIALLCLCKAFFKDSKIYLTIFFYYLFSPHTLFWSRAALPDFASVFFGLMYILFFVKWMTFSKKILNVYFLLAIITGILGYLCKSTSMFPVVIVLAFFIPLGSNTPPLCGG
jgi:4-amino-4-deoxy-L-arabinose transferase-like glycosyltransferase